MMTYEIIHLSENSLDLEIFMLLGITIDHP